MSRYWRTENEDGTFTNEKCYTAKDMEAFAEWCYINAEWSKENEWMLFANDGSGFKVTTTQMRERWEVETGR